MSDKRWLHSLQVNVDNDGNPQFASPPFSEDYAATVLSPDATEGGKTLATLKGSALLTNLKYVTIEVKSGTFYYAAGDADGDSPYLEAGDVKGLPLSKALADEIKLYDATASAVVVMEEFA